jgi:hypothetical protein
MSYLSGPGKHGIKVANSECGVPEQQPVRIDQVSGSNNLLEFYDINGNLLSFVDNAGNFNGGAAPAGSVTTTPGSDTRNVIQSTGNFIELSTKAFAGQTKDQFQALSSAGAVVASLSAAGAWTALSFTGPLTGNVTGNLTGNVTGNVTGNLTGNVTGNVTGSSSGDVTLTPATSARNTVVPTADVIPLTLTGFAPGTADLINLVDVSTGLVAFKVGASGKPTVAKKLNLTISTTDVLDLGHNSTGTPAGGFGSRQLFRLASNTAADREAADLTTIWATATDATRKARFSINVWDTAVREALRCEASGSIALVSVPNGTFSCPGGGAGSEKFGALASAGGINTTVVGNSATGIGFKAVAFGMDAEASGDASISIGETSRSSGTSSIAIGRAADTAVKSGAIVLGSFATATANNQLVIGGAAGLSTNITDAYIGSGVVDTAPAGIKLNATGGSGTNIAGASFTLAGGKGTGAGTPGNVVVQVSAAGASGTTLQTLATVATFSPAGVTGTDFFGVPMGGVLVLCAAFTPAGTGADTAEFVVPYSPRDGTTSVTWNVRRIDFRVQTAGGAPAITVEKSTATGAFSATTVGTVTLGSGAFEGNNTTSLGTVASGDKLRFNVGTLATAQNWTIEVSLGAST